EDLSGLREHVLSFFGSTLFDKPFAVLELGHGKPGRNSELPEDARRVLEAGAHTVALALRGAHPGPKARRVRPQERHELARAKCAMSEKTRRASTTLPLATSISTRLCAGVGRTAISDSGISASAPRASFQRPIISSACEDSMRRFLSHNLLPTLRASAIPLW